MFSRRDFISSAVIGTAGLAMAPLINPFGKMAFAQQPATVPTRRARHYRPPMRSGMGGAPLGNYNVAITDEQAVNAVEGAWNAGVRYFDTAPFYGFGLSERRFGAFLNRQKKSDYIISTKVGRVLKAGKKVERRGNWMNPSPFEYIYDYSAAGTRRSIEDSLQRMGIESFDIVLIHDLEPQNRELKGKWNEHFEIARKGAMVELSKMREEGIIKAWGLGVNQSEPILRTLEVADPDVMLAATQYSLIKHEEALTKTFSACAAKNVSIIVGAPLNNGFLSGADRYNYAGTIPPCAIEKRAKMTSVARAHGIDLRTAALQFCAAHPAVAVVIPGARSATQSSQNQESMEIKIPAAFWTDLKEQGLIAQGAPVPG